jgi:nicotinate-nucleotide adenylyltransferase
VTRLGLLGGTFDPPHYGHLLAAQEAACQLELDRVLFLPARQNPLKQGAPSSEAHHRCEMVALAIDDNPLFELSRLDLDRSPPSYTVDLLRMLKRDVRTQHSAAAAPELELFFLVGADILPELPRWREPDELLRLAQLVVVNRPGSPQPDLAALEQALPAARDRVVVLKIPGVDVSARALRDRVRAGQSLRYLTPAAVERYIQATGLYRADAA